MLDIFMSNELAPIESVFTNAMANVDNLQSRHAPNLGPYVPAPGVKIARLTVVWREALLLRLIDLSSSAIDLFKQDRLVPGCTLTRSFYETLAQVYYFQKKVKGIASIDQLAEVTEVVVRAAWGSKDGSTEQEAIQVLTAIGHVEKEFPGFKGEYEHLCEYAHPNMKGGLGAYVKIEIPEYSVTFGRNPSQLPIEAFGLGALDIALELALIIFDRQQSIEEELHQAIATYAPHMFTD